MKRMGAAVGIGLLAGAIMALAQTEVTSVNAVGFVRHEIGAGKLALLTLNFEPFGNATIKDMIGTQLPIGSKAYAWDPVGKAYRQAATRLVTGWSGPSATNLILRGDAFWLWNAGSTGVTVAIMGEVPADNNAGSTTTVSNVSVDFVGYAYPTDTRWTNTTLAAAMSFGDKLSVWNETQQTYNSYTKLVTGWGSAANLVIPAGKAFFVKTAVPINWTEVAPYNLNAE